MDELKSLTRLGQSTPYVDQYDPEQLVPVPRALSREKSGSHALGCGYDEWWGFELSWLNARGKPLARLARFRFSADSPNLIESKSFKLYLNSFNQTRFADETEVLRRLEADLSRASGATVEVELWPVMSMADDQRSLAGCDSRWVSVLSGACILDELDVEVSQYVPDASLLEAAADHRGGQAWISHLLRSNCPVTGQPDWGSVLIWMEGRAVTSESLLRYIISYRTHQGFHEACVEAMYADLMVHLKPEKLLVVARYTRRGGLDINPVRASHTQLLSLAAAWGRVNRQ